MPTTITTNLITSYQPITGALGDGRPALGADELGGVGMAAEVGDPSDRLVHDLAMRGVRPEKVASLPRRRLLARGIAPKPGDRVTLAERDGSGEQAFEVAAVDLRDARRFVRLTLARVPEGGQ